MVNHASFLRTVQEDHAIYLANVRRMARRVPAFVAGQIADRQARILYVCKPALVLFRADALKIQSNPRLVIVGIGAVMGVKPARLVLPIVEVARLPAAVLTAIVFPTVPHPTVILTIAARLAKLKDRGLAPEGAVVNPPPVLVVAIPTMFAHSMVCTLSIPSFLLEAAPSLSPG